MGQITANVRKLFGQREELFIIKQNVKITLNLTRKIKINCMNTSYTSCVNGRKKVR